MLLKCEKLSQIIIDNLAHSRVSDLECFKFQITNHAYIRVIDKWCVSQTMSEELFFADGYFANNCIHVNFYFCQAVWSVTDNFTDTNNSIAYFWVTMVFTMGTSPWGLDKRKLRYFLERWPKSIEKITMKTVCFRRISHILSVI